MDQLLRVLTQDCELVFTHQPRQKLINSSRSMRTWNKCPKILWPSFQNIESQAKELGLRDCGIAALRDSLVFKNNSMILYGYIV